MNSASWGEAGGSKARKRHQEHLKACRTRYEENRGCGESTERKEVQAHASEHLAPQSVNSTLLRLCLDTSYQPKGSILKEPVCTYLSWTSYLTGSSLRPESVNDSCLYPLQCQEHAHNKVFSICLWNEEIYEILQHTRGHTELLVQIIMWSIAKVFIYSNLPGMVPVNTCCPSIVLPFTLKVPRFGRWILW